jgi:hypothetical protein
MESVSKLSAVNSILASASEAPVSSLAGNAGLQVTNAILMLDEASRDVQSMGWYFNRRTITYSLDTSGNIPLPTNVVSIDASVTNSNYSIRGNKLYDLANNTDIFTGSVELCIVELLEWEDLPQAARQYIGVKAARRYVEKTIGNADLSRFTRQDEAEALYNLKRSDMRQQDYSVFHPSDRLRYRRSAIDRIRNF